MNLKKQLIIKNTTTLKNTLLLGLLLLLMAFFIMPEATREIERYAHGTGIIDGAFGCLPDQTYQKIGDYGEKGRKLYVAVELTADFFYAVVIALFLCSLLVWSSVKSKNDSVSFKCLVWLPFLSFLLNCMENTAIVWMLLNYPERYFFLSLATSAFAFLKLILILACLSIVGWNLILYGSTKFNFGLRVKRENKLNIRN